MKKKYQKNIKIAVDAMGGDKGGKVIIHAIDKISKKNKNIIFFLVGDQDVLKPTLNQYPRLNKNTEIIHTTDWVHMQEKPSQVIRKARRGTSMWKAIEMAKEKKADAVISLGNTGALMAMAKIILKTLPGIERPAIAVMWPTIKGVSVVLDVGATVGANARQLVDFAIMGEAMIRCLLNIKKPTVGLLNIGTEETKGIEQVKEAGQILNTLKLPIKYYGFIEGNDIGWGTVDVVVTEGFSGNIALKTAEGTVVQIFHALKKEIGKTILSKIGYICAKGAFKRMNEKFGHRNARGGIFLGLEGVVLKCHGSADEIAVESSINTAIDIVSQGLIQNINHDLKAYHNNIKQ